METAPETELLSQLEAKNDAAVKTYLERLHQVRESQHTNVGVGLTVVRVRDTEAVVFALREVFRSRSIDMIIDRGTGLIRR